MPNETSLLLWFIGRLLLGGLFVAGGLRHFFVLPAVVPAVAARGIPLARAAVIAASCFEIVAGMALIAGYQVTWAASCLIAFTLVASVTLLNFWDQEGPTRDGSISAWMSNIALIGGLLLAIATDVAH